MKERRLTCSERKGWTYNDPDEEALSAFLFDTTECGSPPWYLDVLSKTNERTQTQCYNIDGKDENYICVQAARGKLGNIEASKFLQRHLSLDSEKGAHSSNDLPIQSAETKVPCFIDTNNKNLTGATVIGLVNDKKACQSFFKDQGKTAKLLVENDQLSEDKQVFLGDSYAFPYLSDHDGNEKDRHWYSWYGSSNRLLKEESYKGDFVINPSPDIKPYDIQGAKCKLNKDCDAVASVGFCTKKKVCSGSNTPCAGHDDCDTWIEGSAYDVIKGVCDSGTCSKGKTSVQANVHLPKSCLSHHDCVDVENPEKIVGVCESYTYNERTFKGCKPISSKKELKELRSNTPLMFNVSHDSTDFSVDEFKNDFSVHASVCDEACKNKNLMQTLPIIVSESTLDRATGATSAA